MSSFRMELLGVILKIPAILIAFTAQGYAKALVADKLGDKTPRFQGRLTLNPAAHIDLIGFIMILIAGFGWTKPLNTNPSAYKRGYKDNRWITFNQMGKKRWKFVGSAKGQGVPVEWWAMKNKRDNKIISFEKYNKIIEENPEKEKEFKISKMSYTVFNGDLVDGLVNDKVEQKQEIISNDYIQNIIDNIGVGYKEEGEEA